MEHLSVNTEKSNTLVPFHAWTGQLAVTVPCGGWRFASAAEAALLAPRVRHRVTGFRDED
jgi:hypothetical protein